MIYKYFYLCYGIRYENSDEIMLGEKCEWSGVPQYTWQKELCEQLNELSQLGWELVQLSPDLIDGTDPDGFGLFRKEEE